MALNSAAVVKAMADCAQHCGCSAMRLMRSTYRLVIKAKYQNDLILIEWVDIHAEYDKLTV